jgi:septum formation protein
VTQVTLASASPRRALLLDRLGIAFETMSMDIDESPNREETPLGHVTRLARAKACAALSLAPKLPVIAADTIVVLGDDILGKPVDDDDARAMLASLQGKTHTVLTSVVVSDHIRHMQKTSYTRVCFRQLNAAEIAGYVDTGEPRDKAGAYAIQGLAGAFISRIDGSYSGVVGLPMVETRSLLSEFGIEPEPGRKTCLKKS